MKVRSAASLLLALALVACGEPTGTPDGGTDAGEDPGPVDAGSPDAGNPDAGYDGPRTLDAVSPTEGVLGEQTSVELRGAGLHAGLAEVRFAGTACSDLVVVSETRASCRTPMGTALGAVDVTAAWDDGHTSVLEAGFEYIEAHPVEVGFVRLTQPAGDLGAAPGAPVQVRITVWAEGVTPGEGQGAGLTAEGGFGPADADPSANPDAFTWTSLPYAGDEDGLNPGDLAHDAYGASLPAPAAGTYRVAARVGAGGAWSYADLSGSDDGFDPAGLPVATVVEDTGVDYCHLQFPAVLEAAPGAVAGDVYGWVYEQGATPGEGQGAGLTGQLGIGPDGSDPAIDAGWTWADASYHGDAANDVGELSNDEYVAEATAPATVGAYDYAFRFSSDAGATWTYCDLAASGGSSDGYQPEGAGALTVAAAPQVPVDYCQLQWPFELTLAPGATSETVYGRVYHEGVTPTDGASDRIEAQLGFGADGSDPESGWTWADAAFNVQSGNDDEYGATLVAPATEGAYDYAYRFRLDGGPWTVCDRESTSGSSDGYQPAGAGALTVAP